MNKQTLTPLFLSFTVLSGALSLTGCEKMAEKATEKVLEEAIKADSDGEVDVDIDINGGEIVLNTDEGSYSAKEDGNEITMKSKDGNVTSVTGENVKLPDDFPSDVPLPDGLKLAVSIKSNGSFLIGGEVKGSYKNIATNIKSKLDRSGWKEIMPEEGETNWIMEKDDRRLTYIISDNNDMTEINISLASES